MKKYKNKETRLDLPLFLSSLIFTGLIVLYTALKPIEAKKILGAIYNWVIYHAGFLILLAGLACLIFLIYFAFGKYGKIKLGGKDTKPDFKFSTYAFMMLTTGVGSSLIYWAMGEPIIHLAAPPMYAEPNSIEATFWAITYPLYHWGPIAWAIYCIPALPFAYYLYNKQKKSIRVSDMCQVIIGQKNSNGLLGYIINILVVFGTLASVSTSMGYCTDLIASGLNHIFQIPYTAITQLLIIISFVGFYTIVVLAGMKKGIARLSDFSLYIAIGLAVFVLIVSSTGFIFNYFVDSIGLMFQNFIVMSTWLDPIGGNSFPHDWTVYYWSWFFSFSVLMGLIIAKISKGRTIKEMILSCIICGSGGCAFFIAIFGGHAVESQITGKLPLVQWLGEFGTAPAVIKLISALPLGGFVLLVFLLVQFFLMSVGMTSATYGLSMMSTKNLSVDQEPATSVKIAWSIGVGGISMVSFLMGGSLESIKTLCVIAGFPMIFIAILITFSLMMWLKEDIKTASRDCKGNIIINHKTLNK